MKFTIERSALLPRLAKIAAAAATRDTVPILTCVLLTAEEDSLSLTASDTNLSAQTLVTEGYQCVSSGSIALPAKPLLDVVKKLPDRAIEFEVAHNNDAAIRCGSKRVTMTGIDPEEYPSAKEHYEQLLTLPMEEFRKAVQSSTYATSTNESTPLLMGVQWEVQRGKLCMITCDRHRLGKRELDVDSVEIAATLPEKILSNVASVDAESVEVLTSASNKFAFVVGDYRFTARLIEGQYPNTSRLIPTEFTTTATVPTAALIESLELILLTADGGKSAITRLSIQQGAVEIESKGERGRSADSIPAETDGQPLVLSINGRYLLDALRAEKPERITILANTATSPVILRAHGCDSKGLHLVLPYRATD